ncbi:MAG TPA: hypothetical protein VMT24_12485, partial [Aggregatilineaceae bacterium]|nr:hypothetical protein [Aggregatilineaceae bacterium]
IQGLPSSETLETVLLKDMEFNENVIHRVIDEFIQTLEYAKLIESKGEPILEEVTEEHKDEREDAVSRRGGVAGLWDQNDIRMRDITIPLIGGDTAILRIPYPLSKKNLRHLTRWLELMEESLTEPDEDYSNESDEQ